jgi:hypothetical protein
MVLFIAFGLEMFSLLFSAVKQQVLQTLAASAEVLIL